MRVIYSRSTDVYHNLAVEDTLLDDETTELPVVFVYRNDDAVVLGKNQNPWRECDVGKLDKLGVRLARRVTGGGTVFHDRGNINISCVLPRETYDRSNVLQWTINGLKQLGIDAGLSNETSIVVDGKKISGNAFCYRRNRVLHHGTLLWDAKLDVLRASLKPALDTIETRAISSVRMPVVNLKELLPERNPEAVTQAVVDSLCQQLGAERIEADEAVPPDIQERIEKMASWEWLHGHTPDFSWAWEIPGLEPWIVHVHRGIVRSVDGGGEPLIGQRFGSEALLSVLEDKARLDWLRKHPF